MRMKDKNAMNSVKMKRDELLAIVRENKIKHMSEYLESVSDYKKLVLKIANDNLNLAVTGDLAKIKGTMMVPSAPHSYENDYARAARMLELSVDDIIEIEDSVFNQLVLDEWHWKHSFTSSIAAYKSML